MFQKGTNIVILGTDFLMGVSVWCAMRDWPPAALRLQASSSASFRSPSDRDRLKCPQDILAFGHALSGSSPFRLYITEKEMPKDISFFVCAIRDLTASRRFACRLPPRLPFRSPSDRSRFECPPDILTFAHALPGVYDTIKLPKKSVRIPWNQRGNFLKKGGTYCFPFTFWLSFI